MAVDYSFPPWQQWNPGVTIPETLQRSRQLRQQQAQQMFERGQEQQRMAIEQQEWAQKQKIYEAQATAAARKYTAQMNLNKSVEAASKLPPGSPERAAAVNSAYLQYGVDAGVGSAALGAAVRGSQAARPPAAPVAITQLPIGQSPPPKPYPSARITQMLDEAGMTGRPQPAPSVPGYYDPKTGVPHVLRLPVPPRAAITPRPAPIPRLPEGSTFVPESGGVPAHWSTPVKTTEGAVSAQTKLRIAGLQKAQTRLQRELDNVQPTSPKVVALTAGGMKLSEAIKTTEQAIQDQLDANDKRIEQLEGGDQSPSQAVAAEQQEPSTPTPIKIKSITPVEESGASDATAPAPRSQSSPPTKTVAATPVSKSQFDAAMSKLSDNQRQAGLDAFDDMLAKELGVQGRQVGSSVFKTSPRSALREALMAHPDARPEGISDERAKEMWGEALRVAQSTKAH